MSRIVLDVVGLIPLIKVELQKNVCNEYGKYLWKVKGFEMVIAKENKLAQFYKLLGLWSDLTGLLTYERRNW